MEKVTINVFVSGHLDLTQEEFEKYYKQEIDNRLKNESFVKFHLNFYIGDCKGGDLIAFKYIFDNYINDNYLDNIYVCVMDNNEFSSNYNYPKHHKVKIITGFKTHEERDCYMTKNTDYDILWIRHNYWNSGTAQNFVRRTFLDKKYYDDDDTI